MNVHIYQEGLFPNVEDVFLLLRQTLLFSIGCLSVIQHIFKLPLKRRCK